MENFKSLYYLKQSFSLSVFTRIFVLIILSVYLPCVVDNTVGFSLCEQKLLHKRFTLMQNILY